MIVASPDALLPFIRAPELCLERLSGMVGAYLHIMNICIEGSNASDSREPER